MAKKKKKSKKRKKSKPTAMGGRAGKRMAKIIQKLFDGMGIRLNLTHAMNILEDLLLADADKYFSKYPSITKVYYGISSKDPRNPVQVIVPVTKRVTKVMVEKLNPGVDFLWVTRSYVKGSKNRGGERRAIHIPRGPQSKRAKKLGADIIDLLAV